MRLYQLMTLTVCDSTTNYQQIEIEFYQHMLPYPYVVGNLNILLNTFFQRNEHFNLSMGHEMMMEKLIDNFHSISIVYFSYKAFIYKK